MSGLASGPGCGQYRRWPRCRVPWYIRVITVRPLRHPPSWQPPEMGPAYCQWYPTSTAPSLPQLLDNFENRRKKIVSASAVLSWLGSPSATESVTLQLTSCASYELVKTYRQANSQFAEDEARPLSAANTRISGDKEMASKLELNVRFTRSHLVSWGCSAAISLNIRN